MWLRFGTIPIDHPSFLPSRIHSSHSSLPSSTSPNAPPAKRERQSSKEWVTVNSIPCSQRRLHPSTPRRLPEPPTSGGTRSSQRRLPWVEVPTVSAIVAGAALEVATDFRHCSSSGLSLFCLPTSSCGVVSWSRDGPVYQTTSLPVAGAFKTAEVGMKPAGGRVLLWIIAIAVSQSRSFSVRVSRCVDIARYFASSSKLNSVRRLEQGC